MTTAEAQQKVWKLLALASPGSGASSGEAASARSIAEQLCAKYGVSSSAPSVRGSVSALRTLSGRVAPGWAQSRPPVPTPSPWRGFGREAGYSGISDAQARVMAIQIIASGAYLDGGELEIVEGALNGLLTEYGKILLDGLYALAL